MLGTTCRVEYPELQVEQISDDYYAYRKKEGFVKVRGHRVDISVYGGWLKTFAFTEMGPDHHQRYFIVEALSGLCIGEYWNLGEAYTRAFGALYDLGIAFGEKAKVRITKAVRTNGLSPRYKDVPLGN